MSGQIIAIASPKPGCGKSTLAQALVVHGWTVLPFAATLKAAVTAMVTSTGGHVPDDKTEVIPGVGQSFRTLCQVMGVAFRELDPDFWVKIWQARAATFLRHGGKVVVDDLRFPNELEAIRSMGGQLVWLDRQDAPPAGGIANHCSEGQLRPDQFDFLFPDLELGQHAQVAATLHHGAKPVLPKQAG